MPWPPSVDFKSLTERTMSPEEKLANKGAAEELAAILSDEKRKSNIERVASVIDRWEEVCLSTLQPVTQPVVED